MEYAHLQPGSARKPSHNVDDSGFFSLGVLEEALKTYQLRLVRWDSEKLRPLHPYPEEIPAYVFNLEAHWFTIRRFAENPDLFFNLNSFLPKPERVSRLYLGLQLQQAQREGYSVFGVLPDAEEASLPQCPADVYFLEHPELAFHSTFGSGSTGASNGIMAQPVPSSSRYRPRPSDFDTDAEAEPAAKTMRYTPPESDEEAVRAATSALQGSSLDDEEEQIRRAIAASLQDVEALQQGGTVDAHRGVPPDLSTPIAVDRVLHVPRQQTTANVVAEEDDSPSLDELRRRRLARFQ